MIYLDTSASVTLVQGEPETPAPSRRVGPSCARADLPLTRIDQVDITRAVLEAASRLPDPSLRSLDAIHLATALQLGVDLDALVTYDSRLAAAGQQRLPVVTP